MLTPEQREARRRGIGSSDIPAIVGVSPHAAPIDVYLDKLGLSEERATPETAIGDRAEAFIASIYEERADLGLTPGQTNIHPAHPWAHATPDRWRDDAGAIVEIKLVGAGMVHLWRDGLPAHVQVQVQWQLEVCDVERADVAALLGGTDFQVFPVERDRDMGADLLDLGRAFWEEHVLARVPPPMTGEDARRLVQLRYPMSMGDVLPATPEAEELRDRILRVKKHLRWTEDVLRRHEAAAMELVGNADGVKGCFSWKRAGKAETWKAAARERFMIGAEEAWAKLEEVFGDDEEAWQRVAMRGGATALVKDMGAPRRRFLTKEPKNGGERQ